MAGWVKAVLFLLGGLGAAAGTAYVTGALDPLLAPKPAVVEPAPQDEPAAGEDAAPQEETEAAAETGEPATTDKQDRLAPPVFDVLRVEPDGSVLVAGSAAANALVEVLLDEAVLGKASAGVGGDFVVLLDEPLAPGDYRLALRATAPDETVTLSESAAIVSIPEREDGQVLAMIEEPGQPAQLVAVPEAPAAPGQEDEPGEEQAAEAQAVPDEAAPVEAGPQETASEEIAGEDAAPEAAQDQADEQEQEAAVGQEAAPDAAAAPADDEPDAPAQPQPAAVHTVVVEAVEIEGDTVFVAGRADAGSTVRVYAGTVLLGDAVASEGGRFLVEAKRHLEVGNYLIRADLLGADGSVVARAAVPFEREPGETIAAVAPPAPAQEQPQEAGEQEVAAADGEQDASPPATEAEAAPEAESAAAPAAPEETAEAEAEVTAAPLQRVDGAVIIRRGDSLWRISRRVYGHGIRYSTIYLANQDQIHDPNRIWPGQVFTVPGETPEGEQADLDAIGDQAVRPEDRDPAAK